jgi:sterol desaturase/sphingolipid hydroxylase (fatty acid hydroxylase superfamily)
MQNIELWDFESWPVWLMIAFPTVIIAGLELLTVIVTLLFNNAPKIAIKGKHLDKLETLDIAFITFNKLSTIAFVYNAAQMLFWTPTISKRLDELTIGNTIGSLIAFYIFYDFFYLCFHQFLHVRAIYPYIHKHHHRQKAPSRGNADAINVHPFEFVVGEYLHLLTIWVIPCHMYTAIFFVIIGGILASLNHTRFDVSIPFLYSVKVHDVHHRMPESNYAQYTMFWDRLFGSYRSYTETEKVHAE